MVYESDFYTTRRPYSRPLATSYTVTTPAIVPLSSLIQVRTYPHLPYVAHKRLVTFVHTPVHSLYHTGTPIPIRIHSRVRPSVLAAEYSRIRELPRTTSRSYTQRYLNSKDNIFFDDETREIRAKAESLLRRIHVFVPRLTTSDYEEEILPERMRSDDYIRRILGARKNVAKDLELAPWYTVPEQRSLGKGTLACVEYVGGKPHSRRRPYYKLADLRPADVKSDVNLLSFYSKNRQAAANASPASPLTEREIRKARAVEPEWTPSAPVKMAASPLAEPELEEEPVVEEEKKKEKKEKKKEKEVKKPDEEALRRAKEFLEKQAEEARLEEEKRKAEEERLKLERDEEEAARAALEQAREEARLAEIEEQERLEAERKIEEERLEAERLETERMAEEERLAAEIAAELAAAAEEERFLAHKAAEEERKKQEEEERLAAEAAAAAATEAAAEAEEEQRVEEAHEIVETQQELEEKPVETIVDEEPQIDEVDAEEDEAKAAARSQTFVEEPVEVEGGESQPEETAVAENDAPQIEEVASGDAEDIWGDNEDA